MNIYKSYPLQPPIEVSYLLQLLQGFAVSMATLALLYLLLVIDDTDFLFEEEQNTNIMLL